MIKRLNNKPTVYIDGENFMHGIAQILIKNKLIRDRKDIDFVDFRYMLEQIIPDKNILIRYYSVKRVEIIRRTRDLERKTKAIVSRQRKLRSLLFKQEIEFIGFGRIRLRDGDKCKKCHTQELHLQEKGVDVGLAVDMTAHASRVKTMYLVSSDSDLLPAIIMAKSKRCRIVYVGFSHRLTDSIADNVDNVIRIKDKTVIEAYHRTHQAKLL